jgi:CheY-like chemotaxis protein
MASLLNDLLDIARITGGKLALRRERVSLTTVVDAALETASPLLAAKRHQLRVNLGGLEHLQLTVDPLRISQVLSNLLGNAAKYTPPGGRIELSARASADTLSLGVKDSGIGIPPEALAQIFEMFWQVRDDTAHPQGGLGIGLALVKSLVELHGGGVQARSEGVGRGSELVVHLPVDREAHVPPQPQPGPVTAARRPCRVLLADDNRDAANTMAVLLSLAHHEVRVVHGGAAALKLAESFRPDVALLDIAMPELDGYGVARALRQAPWATGMRLIAVTGRGQEEDKQRARAAGFDHHMTKPIDPEALEQLLAAPPEPATVDQ